MPSAADDFDPELLAALGLMVVRFAALEEALRDAILFEAKSDKIMANVLISGLSFTLLVDKFGAVFFEHYPGNRTEIAELCSHLLQLNDQRNQLVHSFWTPVLGSPDVMRFKLSAKAKTGLVLRSEGVPASQVHALVANLGSAEDKVWEIITRLSIPLPTLGT